MKVALGGRILIPPLCATSLSASFALTPPVLQYPTGFFNNNVMEGFLGPLVRKLKSAETISEMQFEIAPLGDGCQAGGYRRAVSSPSIYRVLCRVLYIITLNPLFTRHILARTLYQQDYLYPLCLTISFKNGVKLIFRVAVATTANCITTPSLSMDSVLYHPLPFQVTSQIYRDPFAL